MCQSPHDREVALWEKTGYSLDFLEDVQTARIVMPAKVGARMPV